MSKEYTTKVEERNGSYYVTREIQIDSVYPTKWDFLSENERRSYENTLFTANGTGHCSECNEELKTEADFAKHFIISDIRFLNLGYCRNKP